MKGGDKRDRNITAQLPNSEAAEKDITAQEKVKDSDRGDYSYSGSGGGHGDGALCVRAGAAEDPIQMSARPDAATSDGQGNEWPRKSIHSGVHYNAKERECQLSCLCVKTSRPTLRPE